ncbi:MAG TPA: phosphoribosylglycinamide formyltransferase [Planctomycetaceae bacterium]|nr:phosphoribosylglycinamide formyltransferase [Planctomycetaceae bacterium]
MKKLRLAVLISGTGRSLKNLLERIEDGTLSAEVAVVISSSEHAKGLQFAEMASVPIEIIDRIDYHSHEEFGNAIFDVCRKAKVDLGVMAGYVKLLNIPGDFHNRVLNIHPSLVPAFSGKGFYGQRVHTEALRYGVKVSGCTVHFVDNEYDNGPVILQKTVEVFEDDTPDDLNDRVFAMECVAYPEAIQLIAEGRVSVRGRKVRIAPPDDQEDY